MPLPVPLSLPQGFAGLNLHATLLLIGLLVLALLAIELLTRVDFAAPVELPGRDQAPEQLP